MLSVTASEARFTTIFRNSSMVVSDRKFLRFIQYPGEMRKRMGKTWLRIRMVCSMVTIQP